MSSVSRWEDPRNGCRTSCSALMDMSAHSTRRKIDKIDKRCINLLLISAARMNLYLAPLSHRDYFRRSNSSLSGFSVPQGLFPPPGFIPPLLFCSTRIISADQMHLYLALLFHRDAFHRPDASLSCSFVPQGLFCPSRMHLYLPLLLHRDYFHRSNSSLSGFSVPQGLFPPPGFIPPLLFWLHRDYFSSTSNLRSQPNTHFAADMFPYKKPSLFRCRASNPNFRKNPESMFFNLSYATLDALRKQSSHSTLCSVCTWLIANA